MIRTLLLATAAAALGGCAIPLKMPERCEDRTLQGWVGQRYDAAVEARLKDKSHAYYARIVRPGEIVTTEFNPKRLTIDVDDRNTITALRCG